MDWLFCILPVQLIRSLFLLEYMHCLTQEKSHTTFSFDSSHVVAINFSKVTFISPAVFIFHQDLVLVVGESDY